MYAIDWSRLPYQEFSDRVIANTLGLSPSTVKQRRVQLGLRRPNCADECVTIDACVLVAVAPASAEPPRPLMDMLARVRADYGYLSERGLYRSLGRLRRLGKVIREGVGAYRRVGSA